MKRIKSYIRSLSLASVMAAMCVSLVVLPTTGCTISAAQVKADGAAVASALVQIAQMEQQADPQLADQLSSAASGLVQATSNWTVGSPTAVINDVATVIEAILARIPATALIAPLLPIAVAAIDVLIAQIPTPTVSMVKVSAQGNPYRGKATIHHRLGRSPEGDFKAAWNDTVKAHPQIPSGALIH